MKLTYHVFCDKKKIPLEAIKVPSNFGTPNANKLLRHYDMYLTDQYLEPIVVDETNTLIDGYISLIIAKDMKLENLPIYKVIVKFK